MSSFAMRSPCTNNLRDRLIDCPLICHIWNERNGCIGGENQKLNSKMDAGLSPSKRKLKKKGKN